jgi:proteic killer suppression protein
MIREVRLSKRAQKDLKLLPLGIAKRLRYWVENTSVQGLYETRKIPGYHDEPLQGARKGQRSIRLNRSYRAIYEIQCDGVEFIMVTEVNKHDY